MPRHNVIYVDTTVCLSEGHQGLSRCIVGHPTGVNVTSLSRGNHFHRSINSQVAKGSDPYRADKSTKLCMVVA